ncbi:MAG: hypothetical protein ACOYN3_02575 [Acidimicrobiia bacterium]
MNVIRRIAIFCLVIACLCGAGFVLVDTMRRGTPRADTAPVTVPTTVPTPTAGDSTVATFPVSKGKNPFQGLVQLPATATTQPK